MFLGIRFVLHHWSWTACTYSSAWPVAEPACQPVINYRASVDKVRKAARRICTPASGVSDRHFERLLDTHTAAAVSVALRLPARCLGDTAWRHTNRNFKGYSIMYFVDDFYYLLHCALSLAAQCIVIGPVCGYVCNRRVGGVCYHDNSKLCASIFTKLGL